LEIHSEVDKGKMITAENTSPHRTEIRLESQAPFRQPSAPATTSSGRARVAPRPPRWTQEQRCGQAIDTKFADGRANQHRALKAQTATPPAAVSANPAVEKKT
jgi:hypothetical protein